MEQLTLFTPLNYEREREREGGRREEGGRGSGGVSA